MNLSAIFWYVAGLLSGLAVLVIAWPLRRQLAALGLQGRRWLPLGAIMAGALVLALFLYSYLGETVTPPTTAAAGASATGGAAPAAGAAGSMEAVIVALESRLRTSGGADSDWQLLAQSYDFLGRGDAAALARKHQLPPAGAATAATPVAAVPQALTAAGSKLFQEAEAARSKRDYPQAAKLYAQLVKLDQMNADAWADYADVTASMNNNSLAGAPETYLKRALQLDPNHAKALWLEGSLQHESARYGEAVATWKRLLSLLAADSSDAKLISANIAEDTRLAGGSAPAVAAAPGSAAGSRASAALAPAPAAAAGTVVRGEVELADALKSKVRAGMTLYIVAKSVASPGAPVAALRTTTGSWPVKFELSDAMAMIEGRNLSSAGMVTIEARISLSGLAASAPGDLLGTTAPMQAAGAKPLRIVISKIVN